MNTLEQTEVPVRQRELGTRLRWVRTQQGLSLAQVERRSEGRWKAVVVGAYERGDRAVTIGRLAGLARFYGVPLGHLLPDEPDPSGAADRAEGDGLLLDVEPLLGHTADPGPVGAVARFADRIRRTRGDLAGRVLTLRGDDARTIALAAGVEMDDLQRELALIGVLLSRPSRPA